MDNKIKRYYIMPEVWVTVTQSQVFNWIKLVNDKGISTDCISITNNKMSRKDISLIEKSLGGKFIQIYDFRKLVIRDVYIFFMLMFYYFKNVFSCSKIIFQTRIDIGFSYKILNYLPKLKLIFEARGAGNEERDHSIENNNKKIKHKIKNYIANNTEKTLLKKSDKVFCVSYALKNYYAEKFNLKENLFEIFPGAADVSLFYCDKNLRKKYREILKLKDNNILITYSGRLEMKWEIPDKIFTFFKDLYSKNSNFNLLIITPDINIAKKYISKHDLTEVAFSLKSNFDDVNKYLNASDVGLLLREDVIMNNVASPTKFAEYLMTGLPVIISKGIHDFAQDINQTGYGVVVDNLDYITDDEIKKLNYSLNIEREIIAEWGQKNLSKKTFVDKYVKVLKEI